MYQWLKKHREVFTESAGLNAPATEAEIQALESAIGVQLSPSHRAFLLLCNGAKDWGVYGCIFSTTRLFQEDQAWGFQKWNGQLQVLDPDFEDSHYHSQRPTHFLIVAQHNLGADCYCVDTYSRGQPAFFVCKYDAEYDLEDNTKALFVDFEAFLLAELGSVFEMIEDERVSENEALWLELEQDIQQAEARNQICLASN